MNSEEHLVVLYILQIITLYNVVTLGWKVKKIGTNTFELYKKMTSIEKAQFDLDNFLNKIIRIEPRIKS